MDKLVGEIRSFSSRDVSVYTGTCVMYMMYVPVYTIEHKKC